MSDSLARASGPLFIDLLGLDVSDVERELLAHPLVAGVILFSRNYQDRAQLVDLLRMIREASRQRLLVVVDQEGGRVQRFRDGFSRLPAPFELAQLAEQKGRSASEVITELGWLMASELRACDIDMSLAPVLDCRGISEVIGDRAFAEDPDEVVRLAGAWIDGMHQAGMAASGKHFPGHGSVQADSHLQAVEDHRSLAQISRHDLVPFARLIERGQLDAIMPAHVIYTQVCDQPAGFSSFWLKELLRQQYHFDGLIFSDDLSMKAASSLGSPVELAQRALEAGCDFLLACNDRRSTELLLDGLPHHLQVATASRLYPQTVAPNWQQLQMLARYQKAQQLLA